MGQHGRSNQKACSFHDLCGFAGVPQEQRVERPTVAELLEFEMFVLELFRVFGPLNRAARICRGRAGTETNSNRPRKGNVGGARRPVSRVLSASCDAGRSFLWDTHRCVPRATNPGGEARGPWRASSAMRAAAPIRSCSRWGLPCRRRCRKRGALLPHRFTLACRRVRLPGRAGGLFSVALSLGSPPPAVSRHRSFVEPGLSSTTPGAVLAGGSVAAATVRPSGAADPGAVAPRRQAAALAWRCGA